MNRSHRQPQHRHHSHSASSETTPAQGMDNSQRLAQLKQGGGKQTVTGLEQFIREGGVIDIGAEGPGVIELQKLMGQLGFPVATTGVFGETTQKLLMQLQQSLSVQATGKVGPTTLKTLKSAASVGNPLGKFDAYDRGTHIGKVDIFEVDGVRMTRETAAAWKQMKAAAQADGVRLRLNSGFRTMSEQQNLWNAYQNGTGNLAAYPGHSNHQNGIALDIDVARDADYDWMHANGPRFGFQRTVPSEPWHWEYLR